MKGVAVVSANIGNFEKPMVHVPQSIDCDFYTITAGDTFPLRIHSMTPRLQARIVKTHMWQFVPEHEYYLWIDSSCNFISSEAVEWFLNKLSDGDIAVFKHPNRETIKEEADYLKYRLSINCPYITPRYAGEDIDGQMKVLNPNLPLFASTAFIYKDSPKIRHAMKEWWYHISRYHSIDQLSMSWALKDCRINIIEDRYDKNEAMEYVRNK